MKTRALNSKIETLFDRLHYSIVSEDYDAADITLSRLSKYLGQFDDDNLDFYNYAKEVVEDRSMIPLNKIFDEEDYYASEHSDDEDLVYDSSQYEEEDYDEWYDYDDSDY